MKNLAVKLLIAVTVCLMSISGINAQNYKIKQTMTMNGQKLETTTYVRGARKRSEGGGYMGMGADVATIEQCDLKRHLTISDKKKMYAVEPFDNGADTTPATPTGKSKTPNQKSKTEKGGVVTYVSNITDTGERKQMFGLTARRIKTTMSIESSPDACSKQDMKTETDGWYVDLPSFLCPLDHPSVPQMSGMSGGGGCRDQIKFRTTGAGKLGFPLTETRTMKMGEGEDAMSFTQTTETLEFSKQTLDAALFDVPQGYTLTADSQDLYGTPNMSAMMGGMNKNDDEDAAPKNNSVANSVSSMKKSVGAKKPGTIRIGVLAVSNKSSESVSNENLRSYLIQKLSGGNVEAVSINSEGDAKAMSCDYVLATDVSELKQSAASKIGGMFGKVTGTTTSATQKYEAHIDFKLTTADGQMLLQSKAVQKSEGAAETVTETALAQEAQQVLSKAKN